MTEKKTDEADIFNVARKMDAPEARAEYLNLACGGDAQLRGRIEQLLQAHARQPEFLSSPPSEIAPTVDQSPIEHVAKPGNRIGPYRLLEKIGEGGMGTVFMANQERPVQRRVALKIIKPGRESEGTMARFAAERQALAMMDHPNITRVLDAGTTEDDRPYFVMELVKGVPITKYCDDNRLSLNDRLKLFLDVCNAVQHAHQKGVIHRDLKPSNILVAEYDDKAVPKVIDFGLAKALGLQLTEKTMFTGFGEIMGTLEYMSPEQAKFNQLDIDTRSDIYSLGVLLYELVTGSTPFDNSRLRKAALDEAVRIIRDEEPPRPSLRLSSITTLADIAAQRRIEPGKLRSLVRGELDWIVMKTLDKERTRRYQTSAALADDVHRYLTDQRVTARPPTAGYLLRKFVRRNRMAFAVGSALVLTFMVGFGGTIYGLVKSMSLSYTLRERNELLAVEQSKLQEQKNALRIERYTSDMPAAQDAFERGEVKLARVLLERNIPQPAESDLRGIEWDYLWNLVSENASVEELEFESNTGALALSSSGKYLAVAQAKGVVSVLNAHTRERIIDSIKTRAGQWGSHVEFSKQGERLAYVDPSKKKIGLLDMDSRAEVEINVGMTILTFAIAPMGDLVASVTKDQILLHSTKDGSYLNSVQVEKTPDSRIAFTPDGNYLVGGGAEFPGLLVWKLSRLKEALLYPGHEPYARTLAVSPDGKFIATGGYDNKVVLWNAKSGNFERLETMDGHKNAIHGLTFSSKSDLLVSSSRDTTVRIWNTQTMNAEAEIRGKHSQPVYDVLFINNENTLVSSGDRRLCFWQVDPIKPLRILRTRSPGTMLFANDNQLLYTTAQGVNRLQLAEFEDELLIEKEWQDVYNCKISLSSSDVIAVSSGGSSSVEFWSKVSGKYTRMNKLQINENIGQIRYSAGTGKLLACTSSGLLVIEPDGSKVEEKYFPDRSCLAVATWNDVAAILFDDGELLIWNAATRTAGQSIPNLFSSIETIHLEFSRDGNELVCTSMSDGIKLVDVRSGKILSALSDIGQQWSATFANRDRQVLTLGDDGRVTVRDKLTLAPKFAFPPLDVTGQFVAISPSGRWLAARSLVTGEIRIWDVHSSR